MTRVLIYAIPVVLAVWALVDLIQTRSVRARWMPRIIWVIAIIGIPIVGPIAWLLLGVRRGKRGLPGGAPQPPRMVGPDDDPDFLRGIDEQRRRDQRNQPDKDTDGGPATGGDRGGDRGGDLGGDRGGDLGGDKGGAPAAGDPETP